MSRPSEIEKLEPSIRRRLIELLNDPNVTQQAVADLINEEVGDTVVSKSSVNRYAQKMKRFAERNRQAREVAELYLERYGEERQNNLGKVINEQIRMVAFDLLINLEALKEEDLTTEHLSNLAAIINKLSRSIHDLERAATINSENEATIRSAALQEAADEAVQSVREAGLSANVADEIRKKILGLNNGAG